MTQLTVFETQALRPTNLTEALTVANVISNSSLCPSTYRGKPGDVLVAIMMGHEVGLSPMQALQNIAVINGKPSIYGDAALGICKSHASYEYCKEWFEGEGDELTAHCHAKRKGEEEPSKSSFSVRDAKDAKLWGKKGRDGQDTPWITYPKRMLQMRARGFAIRDAFPDALRGLITAEEAQDMPPVVKGVKDLPENVTVHEAKKTKTEAVNEKIRNANPAVVSKPVNVAANSNQQFTDKTWAIDKINKAKSIDELEELIDDLKKLRPADREDVKQCYMAKEAVLEVMVDVAPGQEELFIAQPEELQPATGTA